MVSQLVESHFSCEESTLECFKAYNNDPLNKNFKLPLTVEYWFLLKRIVWCV